jgi:hypothetical protein
MQQSNDTSRCSALPKRKRYRMSKFNLIFKLERIDEENQFVTHGIAGCDVKSLPLENIRKLIEVIVSEAERVDLDTTLPDEPQSPAQASQKTPNLDKLSKGAIKTNPERTP